MVLSNKQIFGPVCIVFAIIFVNGLDNYEEKCTITTGAGLTVDSCDANKFLSCQNGVCRCKDPANQIYSYRLEKTFQRTRSKRGVTKAVKKATKSKISSPVVIVHKSHTSTASKTEYERVYSCYSRVGHECDLGIKNFQVAGIEITNGTLPSSTTTNPNNNNTAVVLTETPMILNSTSVGNETENTPTPEDTTPANVSSTTTLNSVSSSTTENNLTLTYLFASTVGPFISSLPEMSKCVQNAVCVESTYSQPVGNSSYNRTTEKDPRIGICSCRSKGYNQTTTGTCVKSKSVSVRGAFLLVVGLVIGCNYRAIVVTDYSY